MKNYFAAPLIATIIVTLGTSAIVLTTPLLSVDAFTDNEPPEQSCHPPGQAHSHTSENPNCSGGRLPNCVGATNGNDEGISGCRNRGTCSEPGTPACPFDDDDEQGED
jgi:hypothetical protein